MCPNWQVGSAEDKAMQQRGGRAGAPAGKKSKLEALVARLTGKKTVVGTPPLVSTADAGEAILSDTMYL